jgi:simple sugar transport system ATP-binding protein
VRVATLPIGAQQRVEILKALTREATLLILDEPTAVLTPAESRDLLQRMRIFVAQGGTVILITHKLRDAIEFSDDITVLRNGRTVLTGRANEVTETQLAESMIGDGAPRTRSTSGTPRTTRDVLVLDNVAVTDVRGVERLVGATLHIRSGEIVGIAAVEGNGEHELLRVLAGRLTPTHGAATLPSTVGFVPEDRHRDALILDFTLSENVALAGSGTRRGRLHWDRYRANTASLLSKYDVRATGPSALARSLSGGNQQKFVIARELEAAPEALVAENPTRGLDIHATAAVHQRLRDARDAGVAIVMHSTDLDEVLALADRILVVSNGHVREMPHDRERIGRAMVSPV